METLKKLVVTPQGEQLIDLTNEEIIQKQVNEQNYLAKEEAEKIKKQEQEINKQSALNKLKALGLNDAEINSILGK